MTDQASCDICGAMIDKPNGYQLTTQQVVRSPRFWRARPVQSSQKTWARW